MNRLWWPWLAISLIWIFGVGIFPHAPSYFVRLLVWLIGSAFWLILVTDAENEARAAANAQQHGAAFAVADIVDPDYTLPTPSAPPLQY